MENKKAFTLIELVSVLVILAILALIVTPLVLNIIKKARTAADKRSIDAYGRSIELAIADYLLDNGTFPTSIEELTIEYSGARVVCSTTQIKRDSSVYLAGCTVGGRSVDGYTYGDEESTQTYEAYSVGDEVTYNNVDYYVIKNSSTSEANVTLLKKTPITSEEISSYLSSTEVANKVDTSGTYAQMAYYSRDNCVSAGDTSGCSTDYSVSDVKQVVDVWRTKYVSDSSEARLITIDELIVLGYEYKENATSIWYEKSESTPNWVYNENFSYWTMSQSDGSATKVWNVGNTVNINNSNVSGINSIRPVITLSKSEL